MTQNRKSDSFNQCVFTCRAYLLEEHLFQIWNFIPIWLETTRPQQEQDEEEEQDE